MIDVKKRLDSCYDSGDVISLLSEVAAERNMLTARVAELERQYADGLEAWRVNSRASAEREAELEKDAALGRVAIQFSDRAGDVCEEDPAERICKEFSSAMGAAVEALYSAQFKRDCSSPADGAQHG